jgi:hypothetical protein
MSKSFKKNRDFYDEVDEKQKKKTEHFIRQVKKHRREVDLDGSRPGYTTKDKVNL